MPTREQMNAVTREIDSWVGGLEVLPIEDKPSVPEGRRFLFWDELTGGQRKDVLAREIDWAGFTTAQERDVIERVIDGQPETEWMDGLGPNAERDTLRLSSLDAPYHGERGKALHEEMRADYAAAKERDESPKSLDFPDEPHGFQVWHKEGNEYRKVADVESNALGAIMHTHHGFMGVDRWQDNPHVKAEPGEHRSTDIGDVLIGPDGQSREITADNDLGLWLKPVAPIDREQPQWASEFGDMMEAVANPPKLESQEYDPAVYGGHAPDSPSNERER